MIKNLDAWELDWHTASKRMPHFLVPFAAKRLSRPKVLWVNWQYFERRGFGSSYEDRNKIKKWLTDRFAFTVQEPLEPECYYAPETRVFYADRYGASLGAVHGGSGRSGISGGFNVKGIGKTPLCAKNTDWYHRHGCLWLEEAVREVIYSEIACRKFPYGAVPAIAIIDTCSRFHWSGGIGDRRALLIRPNAVRPAHLERSIYFGSSGDSEADQYCDALRVREVVVEYARRLAPHKKGYTQFTNLAAYVLRVAKQIAYGRVHRFFHDYFSSNLSLTGALLDFGSFRSLPNWYAVKVDATSPKFGDESRLIELSIDAISFFLKKYAAKDVQLIEPKELKRALRDTVSQQFRKEIRNQILDVAQSDEKSAAKIVALLCSFYESQNNRNFSESISSVQTDLPWLHDSQAGEKTHESDAWSKIKELVCNANCSEDAKDKAIASLERWRIPRTHLYREALHDATKCLISNHYDRGDFDSMLEEHVSTTISNS